MNRRVPHHQQQTRLTVDDPARDTAWAARGSCVDSGDPELWFPTSYEATPGRNRGVKQAKAVCRWCPVKTQCLAWALAHDERYGIYGGLTPGERARLVKAGGS